MKIGMYAANIVHKINHMLMYISLSALLIMLFFVAADIVGRYVLNKPIKGGMEIQELMMILIIFLALGAITHEKRHIYVELLVIHLKGRTLSIVKSIAFLSSFIFGALLVWQTSKYGLAELLSETSSRTQILHIPYFPFILFAALGLILMTLEFFIDLVISFKGSATSGRSEQKQGEAQDG